MALAGVSAAGNTMFMIMALTQILGVGTVALISHAVGRKDQPDANLVFNQSLLLAVVLGLATLVFGYALSGYYMATIAADQDTVQAGVTYLYWYMPGIGFPAPAVAGQNFGAKLADRVHHTFRWTVLMSSVFMLSLTIFCQFEAAVLVKGFSDDPAGIAVAVTFLTIISWNFVPTAFIFTCSGLFQAIGNTWPAMLSTATRIVTFVVPVIWVSQTTGFEIRHVWFLSVTAVALQAVISYLLLRREFGLRLKFPGVQD